MAGQRRRRDYQAEERRRNERARAAGFTSRAQERTVRRRSAKWSREHAEKPVAFYHDKWSASKVRAYYDAFVNPSKGFQNLGPSRTDRDGTLRRWFVDETHYFSAAEWERSPYKLQV